MALLDIEKSKESLADTCIYFYERPAQHAQTSHLFLNVHYYCSFKGEDGKEYHSCTDYYHTNKLRIMGDDKAADEIHAARSGEEAYILAKRLEGPYLKTEKGVEWERRKVDIMRTAIRLKFEQNPELMQGLIMTADKILVEDHPTDDFWGGSLPGSKNMMGKLLMELREEVKVRNKVIPVSTGEEESSDTDIASSTPEMENKKSESYNEVMKELAIKKFLKCSGITSSPRRSIFKESPVCEEKKKSIEKQADLKKLALKELRVNPPLMYLTNEESTTLVDESKVEIVDKDTWLVTLEDPEDAYEAFFIVKGEAYVFNDEGYLELLPKGTFFGVDGTLFRRRFYGIKAGEDLIVMRIAPEILTKYLKKDSKLTMNISRNMVRKHNIFEPLIQFKSYVRQLKSGASFDKAALINYYKAINSALHPMCNSSDLDIDSWLYANRRLPNNITSTLVFFITTKCPEVLSHPDVALPVKTTSRPRQIFQTMPGKCVAILRDLETDLFDMLSNLCIHIVECKKVLKKLRSPALFRDLLMCRGDQTRVISILQTTDLTDEEIKGLSKIWPNNLGENLANILMHYNDFTMTIQAPSSHLKLDATECWVKKLWFATTDLLKLSPETSCESIPDDEMTIDIVQGSRRAFANMISPYIYVHRADIMKWAAETNPKLITKHFNCEEDRLYAYSYYYFLNHTECAEERQKLEVENGILKLDQPDTTGVAITLVDCSKLKKEYCDPAITPKPATKYHVIINIGYTFGVQSSDIIRSMMNLFGRKIRSINIIGKAGGMTGNKGDLLLATRIHSDESFEVVNNNLGNLDTKLLERTAGRPVHVGPMLTVAGTILQNSLLLNYFKKLCHCVGLEMEGLHFAREIKRYTELGIVRNDVISRFAYYISDLPLDPCSNLSKEEGEISFDEGVPSLNAMYRMFTQALFA